MNRDEWKALHRDARQQAKSIAAIDRRNPRGNCRKLIGHGGTWFNVDVVRDGATVSTTVQPAIIRDRSPSARIAAELAWSRFFLSRRLPGSLGRERDHNAARACIADARAIRLGASLFALLP